MSLKFWMELIFNTESKYTKLSIKNEIIIKTFYDMNDFPGGVSGEEPACQCRGHKRHRFDPWAGKVPWTNTWQPTLVFLPGESHGQRSLVGCSPQGHIELDMTEAT